MADEQSTTLRPLAPPAQSLNPVVGVNVAAGQPLYQPADGGPVQLARADAAATAGVVGLASHGAAAGSHGNSQYGGLLQLTTAQWDAVTGGSGGLAPGSSYFLSPTTAGHLTTTSPSGGGQYVVPIGIALSTMTMLLLVQVPRLVGAS